MLYKCFCTLRASPERSAFRLYPSSHFLMSPYLSPQSLSPAYPRPSPAGPVRPPVPPPRLSLCDAPGVLLFVAFVACGWLVSFLPWPSPPPPRHFPSPRPPCPSCPSSLLPPPSHSHTCPCRPRVARSPPRSGGRCQGSPLSSSPLRPPWRVWRRPALALAQRPVILGIVCNKCRAASL